MAGKLSGGAIQSGTITTTQISSALNTTISAGGGPKISTIIYPGDDTAANTNGGQTLYITGSGFKSNSTVYINGNNVPSVSFISASNLSFTGPVLSAATYPVYVINPEDGATAILIPGLQVSGEPTWVTGATLAEQDATGTWNISLSATGDETITYALAAGSSLPTGISLASNGVISGTLSSPPEADTTYNFTVNAIDAQNQSSSRTFSITVLTSEGILFANNVLLIHADGTNNGNNHSFLDSSNSNFTLTRANNATQGSLSPFSQTGWSAYFDGTGDYLESPDNAAVELGSGDFTIEAWFYTTDLTNAGTILSKWNTSNLSYIFQILSSGTAIRFSYSTDGLTSTIRDYSTTINTNQWYHVAVCRSSGSTKVFLNGTQIGTTTSDNVTMFNGTSTVMIGKNHTTTTSLFNGYLSNLRLVKSALYTSNFTPPTAPLAPIANTSLLALQSNRLIDDGPNNLTITRNGDVSVQAFSPFVSGLLSSNSYSVYFDGNGDDLSFTTISIGSSTDFCAEAWVYVNSLATQMVVFGGPSDQTGGADNVQINISTDGSIAAYFGGSYPSSSAGLIKVGQWYHIAWTRTGSTGKTYLDGVEVASGTCNTAGNISRIGSVFSSNANNRRWFNGHISNARVVSGSSVYSGTFTPSTSPLTAISNTSLLTCQSTTFIDNSTNGFTITPNGNAVPRKINPFGQTFNSNVAYSTANVGGSGYFDGTGDWLLTSSSPATLSGDFTVEGWVYITSLSSSRSLVCIGDDFAATGVIFTITDAGKLRLFGSNSIIVTGTSQTVTVNSWNHIAFVRSSGTIKLYLNGVADSTTVSNSTAFTGINRIGGELYNGNSGGAVMLGYISNYRLVNGTAVYTTNFTPPTTPLTNIANTSLLCNFTNAQIFDQTAKNVLECVGDAKVSTAQYKYGTGSIAFDGTGDYLAFPASPNFTFGTGDFTIETWFRKTANTANSQTLFDHRSSEPSVAPFIGIIGVTSTANDNKIEYYVNGVQRITSNSAILNNVWYHVAVVRYNSNTTLYIDGVSAGNTIFYDTSNYNTSTLRVGGRFAAVNGDFRSFNGHIDDLRITRGYARYTANFTAPTSKFKDK